VSFTLTPMLASKFLKPRGKEQAAKGTGHGRLLGKLESPFLALARAWERRYRRVEDAYARGLHWSLAHRIRTAIIVSAVFVVGLLMFGLVGGEFMPASDDNYIQIIANLPAGTTLEQSEGVLAEIESIVRREVPELESVLTTVGGENKSVEDLEVVVRVAPVSERERGLQEIMNDVREALAVLPAVEVGVQRFSEFGEEKDIVVEVLGPDLDRVVAIARQIREGMEQVPGLADLELSSKPGKPEIVFRPDREELSRRYLPMAAAGMELRNLYEGEVASVYREGGEEYDIRVRLEDRFRNTQEEIRNVKFSTPDGMVPIDALGRLDRQRGLSEITRKDRERMVSVTCNLASGTLVEKINAIQAHVATIEMPPGYRVDYSGQFEMMSESFTELYRALALAIILTYLVLAAMLESWVHPFTIMVTLPLGLVGVSLALVIAGTTINIFSMMAVVMLVGIVVNNAILILDYARQLRQKGYGAREAILEAGPRRLRAIVMTTLAIVAGIVPQAFGGAGASYTVAMAVTTIGGIVASGVLTLFIIPVVYTWFDRLSRSS